ncbi:MAG: DsbA family oxidoreductase [Anaerolineae bacterium]|nr:DsbA family oxidoreductase [Gemmatimonadaceae bacterium]
MKIEIWSDIACPWCYVGKRRFERALASFSHREEVDVLWRSFELDPTAPRTRSEPQAELLARKYGVALERASEMNANMTAEARKEGLNFDFDRVKVGNSFDAHRLIHFAATQGKREAMVERLFHAYLTEGSALGDLDVLVRLAGETGLDIGAARAALESEAFTSDVRADENRARLFGISGVPFFAIDERYGVSGAQPPEALLDALRQAWSERSGDDRVVADSERQ